MAKAVILKTNSETKILGALQCSNGAWFDAEGCFKYCNNETTDFGKKHQASKLLAISTTLGSDKVDDEKWYTDRNNFIDVEIDFETTQHYINKP